ncbi:MAG: autotransporter-associated beta strand repeat-containing protein [Pirellulales bacterium]|nr:autotransporter-associated beta strand repeat-containing protein [Pirellulales bacterium]
MSRPVKITCLVLIVSLGWALPLHAQNTVLWNNGAGDHDFANGLNWDLGYPTDVDVAVIQNDGYADLSTAPAAIGSIRIGADLDTSFPALPPGSGTLNVLSGGSLSSTTIYLGDSGGQTGTLNVSGGDVNSNNNSLCVGYGADCTGNFSMTSGTYTTAGHLYLGSGVGAQGFIDISGGTLSLTNENRGAWLGHADETYGVVNLSGTGVIQTAGTMDTHIAEQAGSVVVFKQNGGTYQADGSGAYTRVGTAGAGTIEGTGYGFYELKNGDLKSYGLFVGDSTDNVGALYQTGGTTTISQSVRVSSSGNGIGTYNLTGGTLTGAVGDVEYMYCGGTGSTGNWGHVNVSGTGQITNFDYIRISSSTSGNSKGYLTIGTGGLVSVGIVGQSYATVEGEGEAFLAFHGGTLQARRTSTNWVKVPSETGGIFVGTEGGIIDTQEFDVGITQPIQHLEGYGVDSITVTDQGADYAGPPVVQISGGSGWGATAVANVDTDPLSANFGKLTGITVTNPGSGYQTGDTLTVELLRGGYSTIATATVSLAENAAMDGGLDKIGTGTMTLAGANTYTGLTDVQAGGLVVTGSIAGDVDVDATASLGGSGSITGDVDLNGTFTVDYDSDADTVDLLTIVGELDLTDSTISLVDVGAGTDPLAGDTYVLATYSSLVGTPTTELGLQTGWTIDYAYDYDGGTDNSIALFVPGAVQIPGDADNSGYVDETDALALATHWGANGTEVGWSDGDFDGDHVVGPKDASIMAAHWNYGTPPPAEASAMPEPSTLAVLLAGLASLAFFRRRS